MSEEQTDAVDTTPLVFGNDSPEVVHMPEHSPVTPNKALMNICVLSDQRLRKLVREEVHRAIYPTAEMANPHEHRRIEMVEQDGRKWRGVLYLVEQNEESV
jgi:hypothetical protein